MSSSSTGTSSPSSSAPFICNLRTGAYNFPSDWRPRCYKIENAEGKSAYQQRLDLIDNAEAIMRKNFMDSMHSMQCAPAPDAVAVQSALEQQCNTRFCRVQMSEWDASAVATTARNYMLLQD